MDKRIAPTIILIVTIILILAYTGVLLYAFSQEGLGLLWKIIIIIVPLGIIGTLLGVYAERLKEIKDEDPEDMNKY